MRSRHVVRYGDVVKKLSSSERDDRRSEPAEPVLGDILRRARAHRGLSLREVERATSIPNAHLSQIERGVIRRPAPSIVLELASFYRLDFALLADWAGYLGQRREAASGMLDALVGAFAELNPADQAQAVKYVERLRNG
ncbi:MAG: helix-turn-helix domain-containing protein [Acidobacteria bacterium]|nr:helix-turn-helix domain-containing protein [Acidobacteriota bacterium]